MKKSGIELIAEKRRKQIDEKGRSIESDVKFNQNYQLSIAAATLCTRHINSVYFKQPKGWDRELWEKMRNETYKERLIIAGALIAAEIDRLQAIEDEYNKKKNT